MRLAPVDVATPSPVVSCQRTPPSNRRYALRGWYQPHSGAMGCFPADPGHFAIGLGATGQITCSVGSYQLLPASTGCVAADVDHFVATAGAIEQVPCAAGTHQPDRGQSECVPLPPPEESGSDSQVSPWLWAILAAALIAALAIGLKAADSRSGQSWNKGPWRK